MALARFLTKRVETSLHVIFPFIELDLISLENLKKPREPSDENKRAKFSVAKYMATATFSHNS